MGPLAHKIQPKFKLGQKYFLNPGALCAMVLECHAIKVAKGIRRAGCCCSSHVYGGPLADVKMARLYFFIAIALTHTLNCILPVVYLLSLLATSDGDKRHINEMGETSFLSSIYLFPPHHHPLG